MAALEKAGTRGTRKPLLTDERPAPDDAGSKGLDTRDGQAAAAAVVQAALGATGAGHGQALSILIEDQQLNALA
jgi:hypothetical protein